MKIQMPTELTKPLPVMHITGLMDGSVLLEWQAETINIERKVNNAPLQQDQACGDCCVLYQSSVQAQVKALFFTGATNIPHGHQPSSLSFLGRTSSPDHLN